VVQRALTWLYRRLGSSHPVAFIAFESVEVVSRGTHQLRGKPEPVELFAPVVQTAEEPLPASSSAR
jgi:hypothetical protein